MVADLFSLLAQTASPKGEAEKRRIAQTASPKGEAGKRRIAQSASTERQAEKGTKDSRGVGKGKAGKRLVRRLEQTSSVCLRRQLPRKGSRERANCAERFYREESRERTKDSRCVGKGKAGKRLVRRLEQTSSVCLRRQLPRRGKPRGAGTIPRRAGIKIDEVYTHIRLRIRGNRFCKAIL